MLKQGEATGPVRAVVALFAGAAMMNAAMATSSVVSTLVVADLLGTGWGGLPNTAAVVATGVGALALTRVTVVHGRRAGLLGGYAAAAAGGALAVVALAGAAGAGTATVVALVLAGMVLLGLGNAAAQLSRYAAADVVPAHRRGLAIGVVVWSGTVGAVGGPLLLRPAEDAAITLGGPGAAGAFALAGLAAVAAALAASAVPTRAPATRESRPAAGRAAPFGTLLRTPAVRSAFVVMATGQVVMVLMMTAVPLALHHHGHGIGLVGAVLSAHTLGMFLLSPLTGRMLDLLGARRVMAGGLVLLVAGAAPIGFADDAGLLALAVFGLGVGWNLCFVGGSGALARGLPPDGRTAVEGTVEAAVWGLAAVASLLATGLLAAGGIGAPATAATAVAVLSLAAVPSLRGRPAVPAPEAVSAGR
jgi:MFS family permease